MSGSASSGFREGFGEFRDPKEEYRKRGLLGQPMEEGKSTEEERSLHMFFSPFAVPSGMNDEEVRTCIRLYPLIQALHDLDLIGRGIVAGAFDPLFLAKDFIGPGLMTRERFKFAADKLVRDIASVISPARASKPHPKDVTSGASERRALEG